MIPHATLITSLVGMMSLIATPISALGAQCIKQSPAVPLTETQMKSVVYTTDRSASIVDGTFSLSNTLDAIYFTATKKTPNSATREALLNSLLATLRASKLRNAESGLRFNFDPRPGEAQLTARDLLAKGGPKEMIPVGLFNRIDLTPRDVTTCGEYRIVYAVKSGQGLRRFFLIFEAAMPNPSTTNSPASCNKIAKLWKDLETKSSSDIKAILGKFYYSGVALDGEQFEPVIHYRHFGLPDGQVRANAFFEPRTSPDFQQWHLLEWKVSLDPKADPKDTVPPVFIHSPVAENPVPAFFGGRKEGISPDDVFQEISGTFRNQFVRSNVPQLTTIDTLAAIPVGDKVTEQKLIADLGIDIEDKFYDVESLADEEDDPTRRAMGTSLQSEVATQLQGQKLDVACGLTPEHMFNRVGAMSCGGCHQFSNGKEIAPKVNWPRSLGFVHISEQGELSELLRHRFLPARHELVQKLSTNAIFPMVKDLSEQEKSDRTRLDELLSDYQKMPGDATSAMANLPAINFLSEKIRMRPDERLGAFTFFRKPD